MTEIKLMKERLSRVEVAQAKKESLWAERSGIEEELRAEEAGRVGVSFEENDRIRDLKRRKIEIDHLLDEIEEGEPAVSELREELTVLILSTHPEEQSAYDLLQERLSERKKLEENILSLIHNSSLVASSLHSAMASWERPVLVRLARYIFGQSPTEEITQHLERAGERSERSLECVSVYASGAVDDVRAAEICEELEEFFRALLQQREERWSFRCLRERYHPAAKLLEQHIERLHVQQQLAGEDVEESERALEEWFSRFG